MAEMTSGRGPASDDEPPCIAVLLEKELPLHAAFVNRRIAAVDVLLGVIRL
jgi:hypothetical protein